MVLPSIFVQSTGCSTPKFIVLNLDDTSNNSVMENFVFNAYTKLVVLTGAGISAESGIRTFRDSNGLWEGHDVMKVASPEGFAENPELVIDFYNRRRSQLAEVTYNDGHLALAEVEKRMGPERFFLITQNVDNLHERAGSKNLVHMHGKLNEIRCLGDPCHVLTKMGLQDPSDSCAECGSSLRPNIVWFGEIPFTMDMIYEKVKSCTHFLYVGTSSMVYPAAELKDIASDCGAKVMCVNLEGYKDPFTDIFHKGKAGEILPILTKSWL